MRLTVVNDHGQVKLLSESKLPPKELLLQLSGREIIVIIKPYLTYRNAFIIAAEQLLLVEPIPRRLLRLMRVNSAGGIDERVFLRQLKARV